MIKIDFHTHTYFSYDSLMRPEKILHFAQKKGLTHIVINDHNTINGGLECKGIESKYNINVIIGSEIKTDIGDVTGIFLKEEIKQGPYLEVIQQIKNQNGLCILNHPFVGHNLSGLNFNAFDFIEGYNGRCNEEQNRKAVELAKTNNKPIIAGSDAHIYHEIGNNYSEFENLETLFSPLNHVYKKSHNFYKVYSQLIKGYKKKDFGLISKVLIGAPKKIILNK
ncbi:MAG: PHP domain-containing protein [Bacteroidetes bacterium]|nr:PHP domain-containing protein [Bacteroidota bacterium]